MQFKKAARLGEIIIKELWVKELRSSSLLCAFLFKNQQGEIILEGEVTLVNVKIADDRKTIAAEAFSDAMRAKISYFLITE